VAPVFQDAVNTYVADACLPLREAAEAREIQIAALARGHYPGRSLARGALSGVSSVGYWDARHEQHWTLPWHRNEGIEISYLERGTIDFAVAGRELQLRPGDIAITRPWELHRVGGSHMGPNRLHWLILDVGVRGCGQPWRWPPWLVLSEEEANQLALNLGRIREPVWTASAEVKRCFQLMAQTVEKDDSYRNLSRLAIRINDLLLSMLDLLSTSTSGVAQASPGSSDTVRELLERLARDRESLAAQWTLEQMAAECGLKRTQFVRHVKELTNVAPMHYLNFCRLEHASGLLASASSMSVTEIAFYCGFCSSQYFATLFKQRFGVAPTEFEVSARDQF
jgi:AraC family L-rhamnose operon regulatory protein RhaS